MAMANRKSKMSDGEYRSHLDWAILQAARRGGSLNQYEAQRVYQQLKRSVDHGFCRDGDEELLAKAIAALPEATKQSRCEL